MEASYFVAGAAVLAFFVFIVYKIKAGKKAKTTSYDYHGGGLKDGGKPEKQVEK